jgi:hypothetical protein
MSAPNWIDLVEFATKHKVSLSTLRRRIRAKTIAYKLEKGRYWLQDDPEALAQAPLYARIPQQTVKSQAGAADEHLEEENRRLKAEIAELQTLVRVLEDELSAQ